MTGIAFFVGNPFQSIANVAFGYKLAFMALGKSTSPCSTRPASRERSRRSDPEATRGFGEGCRRSVPVFWIAVMYMGRRLP